MPAIVMRSYRPEDFPSNEIVFPFTVAPTEIYYTDWIDLGAPSIVSVEANVQGIGSPSGAEYLTIDRRSLLGYHGSDAPAATPDGGTADGTVTISPIVQQFEVIGAEEYFDRYLQVLPRWIYVRLEAPNTNTNTATVAVTVVV